jgi:putative heme-binding domain-containing protein
VAIVCEASEEPTDKYLAFAIEHAVRRLRPYWEPKLADWKAVGRKKPWPDFLRADGKQSGNPVATGPKTDPAIAALVAQAKTPPAATHRATPEYVAALLKEVRESGDAKRGAAIFRRAELACVACHRIGNEGGAVGPDLNNLGTAQPLDFIIGTVLEPQREVKEGFEARQVTLKDGTVRIGFRRAADPADLAIFDSATQREVKFPRAQVAEDKPIGSLMPAGLIDKLSREELRDLFRYLSELGKTK